MVPGSSAGGRIPRLGRDSLTFSAKPSPRKGRCDVDRHRAEGIPLLGRVPGCRLLGVPGERCATGRLELAGGVAIVATIGARGVSSERTRANKRRRIHLRHTGCWGWCRRVPSSRAEPKVRRRSGCLVPGDVASAALAVTTIATAPMTSASSVRRTRRLSRIVRPTAQTPAQCSPCTTLALPRVHPPVGADSRRSLRMCQAVQMSIPPSLMAQHDTTGASRGRWHRPRRRLERVWRACRR